MNKRVVDNGQPETASMEQVRELLFGAQLKDMETRFQRQEERFVRDVTDAKDVLKKRIESLENFMQSEVSSILNRIKEEQNEREQSLKAEQRERAEYIKTEQRERIENITQITADLAGAVETFERKINKISTTLDNAERDLRSLLMSESKSLSEKTEAKYQDALAVIAKTAAQIRHDMVYRTSLSSMFTEMVVKLSDPDQFAPASSPITEMDKNLENNPPPSSKHE